MEIEMYQFMKKYIENIKRKKILKLLEWNKKSTQFISMIIDFERMTVYRMNEMFISY